MTTKSMPSTLLAGDTFKVTIQSEYKASDNFDIILKLTGPSGVTATTESYIATSVTDTEFLVTIAPAVTAALTAGTYAYAIVADDGTDEYTIESGLITVELRADLQTGDFRSQAQKMLDAIDAALLGTATQNQLSMSIAGRSISRIPLNELRSLRDYYVSEVKKENGIRKTKWKVRLSS